MTMTLPLSRASHYLEMLLSYASYKRLVVVVHVQVVVVLLLLHHMGVGSLAISPEVLVDVFHLLFVNLILYRNCGCELSSFIQV